MITRKGATRAALLIGPYAIKVPRTYSWRTFLNGLLANMQERMFWYQMKRAVEALNAAYAARAGKDPFDKSYVPEGFGKVTESKG